MTKIKKNIPAPLLIFLGIVFGIFLKLFVIDFLKVSGISMESTIHDQEIIAVNKLAFGITPPLGDSLVIQWKYPSVSDIIIYIYDNKIVVKRCLAIGGDKLDFLTDKGYSLVIGAKKISLTAEQYQNLKTSQSVPNGYILAVGDNYDKSIDSRTYGFVPVKNILGKVLWK